MANTDIRKLMLITDTPQWEVAERLDIGESTLSKLLRTELTDEQKTYLIDAIKYPERARPWPKKNHCTRTWTEERRYINYVNKLIRELQENDFSGTSYEASLLRKIGHSEGLQEVRRYVDEYYQNTRNEEDN